MDAHIKKEIEDYCSGIPYLGFSPQELVKQCKIAYLAYIAKESIEDYKDSAIVALKKNFCRLDYEDSEYDSFGEKLLELIEENSCVIRRLDELNLLIKLTDTEKKHA